MFIQPIVYWTAAMLSMSTLPHPAEVAGHVVFERNDTLLGRIGAGGPVEELSDSAHYQKVDRAEGRSYVLLRCDDRRQWLTVLECDRQGNLKRVRTIVDEKLDPATTILDASFLPDGRLFVLLHVNPSLDVAVALGTLSSDRLVMLGNTFTWDKTGRHIAYFVEPATLADNTPAQLWMDGRKLCDAPTEDIGDLSWDESGTRVTATFPQPGKKDLNLVFRAADGATIAQTTD